MAPPFFIVIRGHFVAIVSPDPLGNVILKWGNRAIFLCLG